MTHILAKSAKTTTQCHDKWDKMKKKYFQGKMVKGVTCFTTTSWVWFNKMNQILGDTTKADGTLNGLDRGYAHAGSSQASNIEKGLLDDDTSLSQFKSAPPQSPPIRYSCIWHFYRYI